MRVRSTVVAAVLAIAAVRCVDLSLVTQFAEASRGVAVALPRIAQQASAACLRANGFINDANHVDSLPCGAYATLNPAIDEVNSALFAYIAALGKLASADISKTGSGFDNLSADLTKGDPKISAATVGKASAAGGLAKAVTNIWANGYRQKEVATIIAHNDSAVQAVTSFLTEYAAGKYRQSIEDQLRYERSYCGIMKSDREPLASDLLARTCAADSVQTEVQLEAIDAYRRAIDTIAVTHAKLNSRHGKFDAKWLVANLGPPIGSLVNAAASVKKAF